MKFNPKNKWFTLIEMLLAITWFLIIMTVVISIYVKILDIRDNIDAKQNLVQESYFTLEKLNILLRDFTIDYEEYFNRSMVWCDTSWPTFSWDVWADGHCDLFTNYWNWNNIPLFSSGSFNLYYCSSGNSEDFPSVVYTWYLDWDIRTWCYIPWYQSFGEYGLQFRNMKDNTDSVPWVVNDEDDEDMWSWPEAILNSTWVKELYLISQDGKQRILFRRSLVASWDWNKNWIISWDTEKRYNIQILKLKWFDVWNNHDFNINNSSWVYDWTVDTRACDYSLWFVCGWSAIWPAYSWYHLPLDSNDWRVNMFAKNITIADRNLTISPTKNPEYSRKEGFQINPYFTIAVKNKLYWEVWQRRIGDSIDNFSLDLQTTLSTKNFYTK
jgi:hypothetical protein